MLITVWWSGEQAQWREEHASLWIQVTVLNDKNTPEEISPLSAFQARTHPTFDAVLQNKIIDPKLNLIKPLNVTTNLQELEHNDLVNGSARMQLSKI